MCTSACNKIVAAAAVVTATAKAMDQMARERKNFQRQTEQKRRAVADSLCFGEKKNYIAFPFLTMDFWNCWNSFQIVYGTICTRSPFLFLYRFHRRLRSLSFYSTKLQLLQSNASIVDTRWKNGSNKNIFIRSKNKVSIFHIIISIFVRRLFNFVTICTRHGCLCKKQRGRERKKRTTTMAFFCARAIFCNRLLLMKLNAHTYYSK